MKPPESSKHQGPSRHQAHLLVAAVRVLEHQAKRPPSVEEIAELLGQSREVTGHLVRALEKEEILQTIKSPFDLRVQVNQYLQCEQLPEVTSGAGFKDEVEEFHRRFEEKQEELQRLFDTDDLSKKQKARFGTLEEELKDFKSPRRSNPFGDSPEESS